MWRDEFLSLVPSRIIAARLADPVEFVEDVLAVVGHRIDGSGMQKSVDALPRDMQSFFPALA